MKYDFFIIGGGIAGSVLAYKLKASGFSVRLYDYPNPSSSSRVAAGLINPVTGRRFSLTWKAAEVFESLNHTYGEMEKLGNKNLFHPQKIVRLCNSIAEYNDWSAKSSDDRYQAFVDQDTELDPELVESKAGAITLKRGGYLDTNAMLSFVQEFLGQDSISLENPIQNSDITIMASSVTLQGEEAHRIILCEGYLAYQSPFFAYLPFTPMKGEILELVIPDFYQDRVFIRGGFLVPFGGSKYRAGATYDPVNLNEECTEKAEENILERLQKYLKTDYSVVGHFAGIRPAVKDRRPLIGQHPDLKSVFLFNGFGSKGSSLAPLMADYLVNHFLNNTDLPEDADIRRYEYLKQG